MHVERLVEWLRWAGEAGRGLDELWRLEGRQLWLVRGWMV